VQYRPTTSLDIDGLLRDAKREYTTRELTARHGAQVILPTVLLTLVVAVISLIIVPSHLEFNNIAGHVIVIGLTFVVTSAWLSHRLLRVVDAEAAWPSVLRLTAQEILMRKKNEAISSLNDEVRHASHLAADCQREEMLPVDYARDAYSRFTNLPDAVKAAWKDHYLQVMQALDARGIK